jgi:alpha-galactosidase
MLSRVNVILALVFVSAGAEAFAIETKNYSIESGRNRLELTQSGTTLTVTKLGPRDMKDATSMQLLSGSVNGKKISSADLEVINVEQTTWNKNISTLTATLQHQSEPLKIIIKYTALGDTGVFGSDISLTNLGEKMLPIESCSSLFLQLNNERPTVRYLDATKNFERQMKEQVIEKEPFSINNKLAGRSTFNASTWWSIFEPKSNLSYTAQFAYSGNWSADFTPTKDTKRCDIGLGMVFDNKLPLILKKGASFTLPRAVVSVTTGNDLADTVRPMHHFLRQFVIPKQPANDPLLVTYNAWYCLGAKINEENLSKMIPLAANIGCEGIVVDANWHYCPGNDSADWSERLGDWVIDPTKFPNGLKPIIKLTHDRGMKFGLWFEPECASVKSNVFREHPDWFLKNNGKTVVFRKKRVHFDFAKPAVRAYMHGIIERIMKEGNLDWIKLDYNINIGNDFDSDEIDTEINTRLHDHIEGYYQWLDETMKKYPQLIIENCASGGFRSDIGIMAHTHTSWISDTTHPRCTPQIAWGALVEMPVEYCNHWIVGDSAVNAKIVRDGTITTTDMKSVDYLFQIAMHGQFGISSYLDKWSPEVTARAKENIKLYKRLRTVLFGADVYHLTKEPDAGYDPTSWMGIQYFNPASKQSVIFASRLWKSEPSHTFLPRALDAKAKYNIVIDGQSVGPRTGADLMQSGLKVSLEKEGYSQVIELKPKP